MHFFEIKLDDVIGEANRLYKEKYGRPHDMESKQIASIAEAIVNLLNQRLQNLNWDISNLEANIRNLQDKK